MNSNLDFLPPPLWSIVCDCLFDPPLLLFLIIDHMSDGGNRIWSFPSGGLDKGKRQEYIPNVARFQGGTDGRFLCLPCMKRDPELGYLVPLVVKADKFLI